MLLIVCHTYASAGTAFMENLDVGREAEYLNSRRVWTSLKNNNGIISLNLPTAVQSPRSKDDGRYDAVCDDDGPVDDVPAEYVLDPVT